MESKDMRAVIDVTPGAPIIMVNEFDTSEKILKETTLSTTTVSFLNDHNVLKVHFSFAVITLLYIPFILITNNLVLWSTILFRKLHTPNNIMLASLAVADLIMGIYCIPMYALSYMPNTQYLIKDSGRYACLAWFASMELGGASSLKNLLLISADRFLAIVYPLSYSRIMTLRTTAIALTVLWLYVIIMAFVPFFGWNNYDPNIKDQNRRCNYYLTLPEGYVIWASFFTITVSIVIPFILNIKIFYTISKQQQSISKSAHLWSAQQIKRFKDQVQTVRITGILFLLFILFWLPYMLVAPLKYSNLSPRHIEMIKVIVQLLYFLNSVVNAPIYALMRTEYKVAYYLLLTTAVWRWGSLRRHSLDPEALSGRHCERRELECSNNRHRHSLQSSVDISTMPRHTASLPNKESKVTDWDAKHEAMNVQINISPNTTYSSHTVTLMMNSNMPTKRSDTSKMMRRSIPDIAESTAEANMVYKDLLTKDDILEP